MATASACRDLAASQTIWFTKQPLAIDLWLNELYEESGEETCPTFFCFIQLFYTFAVKKTAVTLPEFSGGGKLLIINALQEHTLTAVIE